MTKSKLSSNYRFYVLLALLLIALTTVVIYSLSIIGVLSVKVETPQIKLGKQNAVPIGPTPTPTPTKLRAGKRTYSISQWSGAKGPTISTLTFDPLDIQKNQKQSLVAHISHDAPITSARIEFISDNQTSTLPLTRTSGTDTSGDWSTSWTLDDSVSYKYILNIQATSNGVTNTVQVAPRQ